MISLCYKEYEYKLNLAACKAFYDSTGKDLTYTLLRYLDACRKSVKMDVADRLLCFLEVESFDNASKLIHCLIKQENKSIPLAEIQDAMYRVSWAPTDSDDEMCQPWPYVMVKLATEVNEYYAQLDKKKAII